MHHRRSVEGLFAAVGSISSSAVKVVEQLEQRDRQLSEMSRAEHQKRIGMRARVCVCVVEKYIFSIAFIPWLVV